MISKKFITNTLNRLFLLIFNSNDIKDVYNYYNIDNTWDTSGQLTEDELVLLSKKKYSTVINLAPVSSIEKKIINEEKILKSLNINYLHIPVDFKNPTESDFKKFVKYIKLNHKQKIWIHCAANMRVSAFMYKYRKEVLKMDHNKIIKDLHVFWRPNKTWKTFLGLDKQ